MPHRSWFGSIIVQYSVGRTAQSFLRFPMLTPSKFPSLQSDFYFFQVTTYFLLLLQIDVTTH